MIGKAMRNYFFYLIPAVAVPALIFLDNSKVPLENLIKIGIVVPLLLLATRGLATYFPHTDLHSRSVRQVAEHCILQGMLLAGAMMLVVGLSSETPQPDLHLMLRHFVLPAAVWTVAAMAFALHEQRKRRLAGR
jgi:hypothetical protein